jgi:membrane protein implicated in regulation of membrane protease activity
MNRTTLFVGALIVALLSLLLAIYYALPGVYHVLVSGSHPPLDSQPTHIVLFVILAVLGAIVALVTRPNATRRS